MRIQSNDEIAHFRIGDVVRVIGKPQTMKITEQKEGMPHIYIEGERRIHYKCEWRRGDGVSYSAWFEGGKLERAW